VGVRADCCCWGQAAECDEQDQVTGGAEEAGVVDGVRAPVLTPQFGS